jgi:hypothetical protein
LIAAAGMLLIALALHIADARLRESAEPQAKVQVTERQVNYGNEYLIYDICTPAVSGFADADFERGLNSRIEAHIARDQAEAESYAKDYMEQVKSWSIPPYDCVFSAWYEAKCTTGILSLKVTTFLDNGGTGMPHTVYYNADIAYCEMLSLGDLFISDDYKARIDHVIDAQMRKDPERYDVPFKGVTADTQFFISGGRLFIAFAKYEVAGGTTGEPEFEIPIGEIWGLIKQEYRRIFDPITG